MGTIEPAPRPTPSTGFNLGWLLIVAAAGAGVWVWSTRTVEQPPAAAHPVEPEAVEAQSGTGTSGGSGEVWAKNRRIGELETELRLAENDRLAAEQELEALQRQLEEARTAEYRYRQGLDDAVEELNQLKRELGDAEAQASQRSTLDSLLPPNETRPLGPPQVLISQMGFVTVSGLVRNPTGTVSRGRLEVNLVGSAGVIETRGFPMRVAPGTTERYDVTFPNIFPTERIAAQAVWVE
jgi:uncharacterized membrane protein